MPLHNYWAEAAPIFSDEPLNGNAGLGSHVLTYSAYVPTSARIKKLVCSAGITIRGSTVEEISVSTRAMSWIHVIAMIEPGSDAYPSGRQVVLNKQAGSLIMRQAVQRHLLPPVGDNETQRPRVMTSFEAQIAPVNSQMSYGSVAQNIGAREVQGALYIHGVHSPDGGIGPPYYTYAAGVCLRVLYELQLP